MIPEILGTSDTEALPSERILWTTSCIYYVFLQLVENDVKEAGTAAIGESADSNTVILFELGEYKAAVAG